jgi:hypothetical protein
MPDYTSALAQQTGEKYRQFQTKAPIDPFLEAKPMKVAGLSEGERKAAGMVPQIQQQAQRRVSGETLRTDPSFAAAQEAYNTAIMPGIENRAAVSGLGRSTALTNADAAARAAYLQPTIENVFGREERALGTERDAVLQAMQAYSQTGGVERGIEQAGYEAERQDELRRQALAETALGTPMGTLVPSTIGQQSTTRGKQGIFTGG